MITLPVEFSEKIIDPQNQRSTNAQLLMTANYPVLARNALANALGIAQNDKSKQKELSQNAV